MPKFSLKFIFSLITAFAVGFAFLGAEPLGVALAALFCFLGCSVNALLAYIVAGEVVKRLRQGKFPLFNPFSSKSRVASAVGVVSISLLMFTVTISNFVLETSVANGGWFIVFSWTVGPILALWCYRKSTKRDGLSDPKF